MVTDYKGVSFSFKDKRKKKQIRKIKLVVLFLFAVSLILFVLNAFDSQKISHLQKLLLHKNLPEASAYLTKIEGSIFHRQTKKEIRGLLSLYTNKLKEAEGIFAAIDTRTTIVKYKDFLSYFSDRAQYKKLKIYTDYLDKRGEDITFYQAQCNTGLFNFKKSASLLSKLTPIEREKYKKELAILNKINQELKSGKINYIFDVNGLPLAYFNLKTRKTVTLTPGLNFNEFNRQFKESVKFYSLTIDLAVQKKLHQIFKKYRGSFLLFNLNDSSIKAAYYKGDQKGDTNKIFSERYEPGSIIKLVTLFGFLRSSYPSLFPFRCDGSTALNGKIFYDWTKHSTVKNFEEALTVSCNLSFATMGIKLGLKQLRITLKKFYFDSKGFQDLFLTFNTGLINNQLSNNFQLANLSVGLENISITTVHSALLSSIICHNGSFYPPYMIKNKKNLLNLGFYNHESQLTGTFRDNVNFLKLKNAMVKVVESPSGTGRRVKSNPVEVGLKTGTTGSRKGGFNTILTGFFPSVRTKYTFGLHLSRAGKADVAGAAFLNEFLASFYKKN